MEFDWDDNKAQLNQRKHDVTFPEAVQAFGDSNALISEDDGRYHEQRFKLVGASTHRLLAVIFTDRAGVTRLIFSKGCQQE